MVKQACFGVLDKVFPVGSHELREIAHGCFQCPERISCLKAALRTEEGLRMREEVLNRAAASGTIGRFQRWSQKKELNRLMSKQKERNK